MSDRLAWPEALAATPTVSVLEKAIANDRLSHSLLLHGEDHNLLEAVGHAIADRLLYPGDAPSQFAPADHPDCFKLRPTGKSRQISADATRDLIEKVQLSSSMALRKVALIHECDRMHPAAANIFLKTLEEPPANTTLLLLTTRPYALLPTILSRVLHFRFPTHVAPSESPSVQAWINDYQAWILRLLDGVKSKQEVADHIFTVYGLVSRFQNNLEQETKSAWGLEKGKLPPDLSDEEQIAIETGIANGIRLRLFGQLERATREATISRLRKGEPKIRTALVNAVRQLEHDVGLLRVNLNAATALEHFLLSSLRIWSAA